MHPAQWLLAFTLAIVLHLAALTLIIATWSSADSNQLVPEGITISLSNLGGPSEAVAATTGQSVDTPQPAPASAPSPSIPQAAAPAEAKPPPAEVSTPSPSNANGVNVPTIQAHSDIAASQSRQPGAAPANQNQTSSQSDANAPAVTAKEPAQVAGALTQKPSQTVNARRIKIGEADSGAHATNSRSYANAIHKALAAHKTYPPQARRQDVEGRVVVRIIIDQSGKLLRVSVVQSSGHDILDEAAKDAVRAAAPFSRIPASMGRTRIDYTLPFVYGLRSQESSD